jgi:hypothetical protein
VQALASSAARQALRQNTIGAADYIRSPMARLDWSRAVARNRLDQLWKIQSALVICAGVW